MLGRALRPSLSAGDKRAGTDGNSYHGVDMYSGLNGDPRVCVHALIPRTCECDFIWKKGLCICN